ncbi:MAG: hypothetical protein ACLFQW_00210 [Spirochaetaceae bacterium]
MRDLVLCSRCGKIVPKERDVCPRCGGALGDKQHCSCENLPPFKNFIQEPFEEIETLMYTRCGARLDALNIRLSRLEEELTVFLKNGNCESTSILSKRCR